MATSFPVLITNHRLGIRLAAIGVLVLSFDALLIRLANADPWDVAFWRGLLMAVFGMPCHWLSGCWPIVAIS